MPDNQTLAPDHTAVRVALWRALHVQIDPPPHVLEDEIGLKIAVPSPVEDWRRRPDMNPDFAKLFRASVVARARFVEDLVVEQAGRGIGQYVILGAGLDTFAQRRQEMVSRLHLFEVDRPGPQAWKHHRLIELGLDVLDWPTFVPVDFESRESWWEKLKAAGFDAGKPAVIASTGVSMYLTKEANAATLGQAAQLAPGSTFVMTFFVPIEMIEPAERPAREESEKRARGSGTPFISFYTPQEIAALARKAGFKEAKVVSGADLAPRYFAGRKDGLRPSSAEQLLVAAT